MFTLGSDMKGKEVYGDDVDLKILPNILLQDPLLHSSFDKGKFTSYKIIIETEHHAFHIKHSCIRRRFSELRWLYTKLCDHHKQVVFPPVPSKKIWAERFNTHFVNERMKEMQVFLNELLRLDTVLSDTLFHLFLQTDLTTEEMEGYLDGTVSEDYVKNAWDKNGHLHTANELGTFHSVATPKEIEMDSEDEYLASFNKASSPVNSPISSPSKNPTDHIWNSHPHSSRLNTFSTEPTDLEASGSTGTLKNDNSPPHLDDDAYHHKDCLDVKKDLTPESGSLDSRQSSPAFSSVTTSTCSDLSQ